VKLGRISVFRGARRWVALPGWSGIVRRIGQSLKKG
jgi:hypothetical protein